MKVFRHRVADLSTLQLRVQLDQQQLGFTTKFKLVFQESVNAILIHDEKNVISCLCTNLGTKTSATDIKERRVLQRVYTPLITPGPPLPPTMKAAL